MADAPEDIDDDESQRLINIRWPGRGKVAPRKAARQVPGTTDLDNVVMIHEMPHGADTADGSPNGVVFLEWTGARIDLYAANGKGEQKQLVGVLVGYDQVPERPKITAAVTSECLWICDESKLYGLTVYDPNERFEQGKLWQPLFKFDRELDTPAAVAKPRCVETYNNYLFMGGSGTEADPDRPEVMRFSYLGLEWEPNGAGDAAEDPLQVNPAFDPLLPIDPLTNPVLLTVTGGVRGLFDTDDYFFVGPRGQPIVGMSQGAERLVIGSRFRSYILFGYDRENFELDLIDNQRGLVATRAMGEADGVVWWMSPLGPCFWAGGRVIPLERPIQPLLREIDFDTVVFAHQRDEYEARWYFSSDSGDPNRSICYNYLYETWKEEHLGIRIFCAGSVQPGTILVPGPGGDPIPGPFDDLLAPFSLFCHTIGPNGFTKQWTNLETSPEITTRIEIKKDAGDVYQPAVIVESGVNQWTFSGLAPSTTYFVQVRHENSVSGAVSDWTEGPCTTIGSTDVPPIAGFSAFHLCLPGEPFVGPPISVISVIIIPGGVDLYTEIEYDHREVCNGRPIQTQRVVTELGVVGHSVPQGNFEGCTVYVRARHRTNKSVIDNDPPAKLGPWTDYIPVLVESCLV